MKRILTELMEKYKDQKVKLTPSHLKTLIKENERYKFLEDIVGDVPDLEDLNAKKGPKQKQIKKRAPEVSTKKGKKLKGKGEDDEEEDDVDEVQVEDLSSDE